MLPSVKQFEANLQELRDAKGPSKKQLLDWILTNVATEGKVQLVKLDEGKVHIRAEK